jgi:glycosyltransferase involved in cell wall biosynthesis
MTAAGAKRQGFSGAPGEQAAQRPSIKVCLLIDSLGPDAGTEKLVAGLASAFDPHVIETHLCCFEPSERLADLPTHIKTAVFPLSRVNSAGGLRQAWRFRRYLDANGIDVVHSFMNKSAIFSVLASRGTCCRTLVTSRLNCGYWYSKKLIWIFRVLNHYSTHIVTNSAMAKKLTIETEGVSPEKITVFYPGVDLHRFSPASGSPAKAADLGIPADALVVGIVANFRPVKDLELFLRSAAVVSAAVPRAAFLMVGQGTLKPQLQSLAAELGIADRVFFSAPEIPVPDYLARMSVACLSSESEGLPNAVMEYMAAGLPVVSTDVGGISELVRDGFTGHLVQTRTPEAFAQPVIQLLENERLRKAMGQLGLERARAEFDSSAAIVRLQQFYLKATAGAQPRGTATTPLSAVPTD